MLKHIDHVNIVVEDLPTMTAFYRDALGLRVTREITIEGDWIESVTGLASVVADVVYLEAESGAALELIAYRSPQGSRPAGRGTPNTQGLRHFAFRVDDLDTLAASLQASGFELLSPVQQVPTTQVDFEARRKWIAYCHDPEGNLIELCDYR